MELTQEEREQIKARIGDLLTGDPITDAELENLARVSPAAFDLAKFRDFLEQSNPLEPDTWDPDILCLTERLILDGRSADNATKEEMRRALFELMSLTYMEWQRR